MSDKDYMRLFNPQALVIIIPLAQVKIYSTFKEQKENRRQKRNRRIQSLIPSEIKGKNRIVTHTVITNYIFISDLICIDYSHSGLRCFFQHHHNEKTWTDP